ncbi:SRPBCC family protein [Natronomonas sp.]|jgi:ligand-binding SRPBCC domain-containing protein|uniref:SRPBCC family protein n=1 Tax=Natronomonas sp. TaxID=2184060 RepID=UPI003989F9CE
MREVERSRFVSTRPHELQASLDPARIVDYEGSFSVESVTEADAGTLLTVSGPGLAFELRFEPIENGFYYTQAGEAGPFESMETWLTVAPEDEGSRVSMRSAVSLGVPLPFADRIAAWKRAGELERALDRLASEG